MQINNGLGYSPSWVLGFSWKIAYSVRVAGGQGVKAFNLSQGGWWPRGQNIQPQSGWLATEGLKHSTSVRVAGGCGVKAFNLSQGGW